MPESKDPETASTFHAAAGNFYGRVCPANFISAPHFSAKSSQRGFTFSMSATFFERRQPLKEHEIAVSGELLAAAEPEIGRAVELVLGLMVDFGEDNRPVLHC